MDHNRNKIWALTCANKCMEIGVFERREIEKEQRSEKDARCRVLIAFPGAVIKHCDKSKKDWGRDISWPRCCVVREPKTAGHTASRSGNTDSRR